MTRRIVLLPALAVLAAALTACSDDGDGGRAEVGPGLGTEVEGQDWRLPYNDDDITICGDVAVFGEVGETPVVVRADGSTVELEPDVPADSEVDLEEDANRRASCLRDDAGEAVVVVEVQNRYFGEEGPPTLLAGFDAEGTQLWTYDALVDADAQYAGAGAVAVRDRADDGYVFLDAATGEELTRDEGGSGEPTLLDPVPLSTSLLVEGRTVVTFDGEPVTEGSTPAPVDARRALVEVSDGVALLDLEARELGWTAPGYTLPLEAAAVDLSTEVAVLVGEDGALHGLDLATGEERWVSDAPLELFGVGSVGQGVAVIPNEDFTAQVLVDTETGERLPDREDYVIAGNDLLLVVSEDGIPAVADVDDLR